MQNTQNLNNTYPTLACVTLANTQNVAACHEFEQRNIPTIAPKGYYYLPDVGDTILLSSTQEPFSLGCLNNSKTKINKGEIIIKNNSGAYIKFLNNGDIEINSLIISKTGDIKNKKDLL